MDDKNILQVLGVDISNQPDQSVNIFVGIEPKVKCRNKTLQKLSVKAFGYKAKYETKNVKVLKFRAEDFPKNNIPSYTEITFKN